MSHPDVQDAARMLATTRPDAEDRDLLTELLYSWFLNRSPLPPAGGFPFPAEVSLPSALRAAHVGTSVFEGGWRTKRVSTWGRVVASKGDRIRVLDRAEYLVPRRRGSRPLPNDALLVTRCWTWVDPETGFWHARTGEWPPPRAERLVRIYLNVSAREAPPVVHHLSSVLASSRSACTMMKTPAHPDHGGRSDALVLYLGSDTFAALEEKLRTVLRTLSAHLRTSTPRFTKALGPGVALAEGNLDGDSFGQARCNIVADAFAGADPCDRRSPERMVDAIEAAFAAAGLDPGRPHLEPSPRRDYVG